MILYNGLCHTPLQVSPGHQDQSGAVFVEERKWCIKETATSTSFKETQDLSFKSWEKLSFKRAAPPSTAADAADYESRSYLSSNSDDNDDNYENKGKSPEIVTPLGPGT